MKEMTRVSTALWAGAVLCLGSPGATAAITLPAPVPLTSAQPQATSPVSLAQLRTSPPLPPLPNPIPEAMVPDTDGIIGLQPDPTDELGIGHLRPRDLSFLDDPDWPDHPYIGANWLRAAAIPIYAEPAGSHWGWIVNGWLVPNGQPPLALGRDASFLMLQTDYALSSFPVTEIRDDGWIEFKYTPVGTAWTHVEQLNVGQVDLAVERWQDRFLEMGWVEYRQHGNARPLRTSPDSEAAIETLVGADSFIEPLAFEGDWMRVRVTQPTDGCTFLPGARTWEGWMRWRDDQQRSLVWFPARGCSRDRQQTDADWPFQRPEASSTEADVNYVKRRSHCPG